MDTLPMTNGFVLTEKGKKMSNHIEFYRDLLPTKDSLRELVEIIGQTIIKRADEISCDPHYVKSIEINASITTDEVVTISWTTEIYTDPVKAYVGERKDDG